VRERVPQEQPPPQSGVVFGQEPRPRCAALAVDRLDPAADEADPFVGVDDRLLSLEARGKRDVVRVHPHDRCAPCLLDAAIQCGHQPFAALAHDAQPFVGVAAEDLRRRVGRPVVDDHNLEITGFTQQAVESLAQVALSVAHRQQYGHGQAIDS